MSISNKKDFFYSALLSMISFMFAYLCKFLPISYIWGTASSFFSLYNGSILVSIAQLPIIGFVLHLLTKHIFSLSALVFTLPTITGSLFLKRVINKKNVRFLYGLCILVFTSIFMYYNGLNIGLLYITPWFLGLILSSYSYTRKYMYSFYIQSVMVSHMVGTVIHMYMGNQLMPEMYAALTVQVIVERFILASTVGVTIFLSEYCVSRITALYKLYAK